MKKMVVIMVMVIMALAMVGCKEANKTETSNERRARILTSYTEVDNNGTTTIFRFRTYKEAHDFMYYWLDYGYTVSGVTEYTTEPRYYTVEIMEPAFNDVVREARRAL